MEFIRHRVNTINELKALPAGLGAEMDIRSQGSNLILNHEPHQSGDLLSDYLELYAQRPGNPTLVLNPKEDGIENEIWDELLKAEVQNFFFLDLTLPTLVRWARSEKKTKAAVRFSEYEPAELAFRFQGMVEWVWVDCFLGRAPELSALKTLRQQFKICLVSPELQKMPVEKISEFRHLSQAADAVCTKHEKLWL